MNLEPAPFNVPTVDKAGSVLRAWQVWFRNLHAIVAGLELYSGTGSPEGVVAAPLGALYVNVNGGASTLYVKQSGGVTNAGWVAK